MNRKDVLKDNTQSVSPCPFCGCTDVRVLFHGYGRGFRFECPLCKCVGPSATDEETAQVRWNHRVETRSAT